MLLAGDVGATTTRLGLFDSGPRPATNTDGCGWTQPRSSDTLRAFPFPLHSRR
mgnify:CR=1 FL=1